MIIIDTHNKMLEFWDLMRSEFGKHRYLKITMNSGNTRTAKQNAALHLWCRQCAETLNAAGLDFKTFFKPDFRITWTDYMVKEYLWKTVQKPYMGDSSTTKPTPQQYLEIYEILARHLAENHGIVCEWPCEEEK